ncbi:MAG: sodium:solute symporter [Alphaproteobacteria bacterium]|nr:sodium:solute symporter [Alphaproteobacteria bacterium]
MMAAAVFGYVILQLAIAAWASRRTASDTDYLIAGRRLGVIAVGLSVFATWFGGETVLGSTATIAEEGLAGARAEPFGYAITLLLMALLIAGQFRKRGYVTLADFFRDRFGPRAETLAVLVAIPTSVIWAAAQLLAMATLMAVVTGMGVVPMLLAATGLVIVYTSLGGLLGDVITDMMQGAILFAGLMLLLALMLATAGGPGAALAAIDPERLRLVGPGESWVERLDVWMIPILGSLVAQEPIARFLGARSAAVARTGGLVAAGLYLLVGLIPLAFGLIAPGLGIETGEGDLFLPVLARELMPSFLFVIFAGALFSAVLSTVDSALLAIAALATENIYARIRPASDQRERLKIARILTVTAGLAALLIALSGETIYGLVELASSLGSAGLLVCVLAGLHNRTGGEISAIAAILCGLAAILLAEWVFALPGAFMLSIAAAAIAYFTTALAFRNR